MHPQRIAPIGINYLLIEYENKIDPVINEAVTQLWQTIKSKKWQGIIAMTPTYRSLLVHFDPEVWTTSKLTENIKQVLPNTQSKSTENSRLVIIPVLYGGEHGPDLEDVAKINKLTVSQVVDIHENGEYRVYMLGFNPGYPYMGGLDSRLATARLEQPRTKVPAGSVAIGGEQTGIYSTTSPGGWRIIGHTPVPLFDSKLTNPVLLQSGDNIKFKSINQQQYNNIVKEVANGDYQIQIVAGEIK
ncbi:5-oxoprolinase subunit PxpB [Clostridium sp. 'deep sea']|uniref:5-oxoprolinase subunit PxpB n=1 Tax=Clostridium sp. 'deep sea' TaxID=2779445 RepID=UPI001896953B|nr:5-oxoprolinase subunit PxpB [Clostridium sp. 'deep sea']QOR33693.1 5-oxoprolinase subunit PxpB [Clostridium sp. 'deep sea']